MTADQRVIALVGDVAREAVALRCGERLHQVPAGKVGGADIADLARGDEIVERAQRLFDRRLSIEGMHEIKVDVVGAEPLQAGLAGANQVVARRTDLVGALTRREGRLGRNQKLIAPPLDRGAQHFGEVAGDDRDFAQRP